MSANSAPGSMIRAGGIGDGSRKGGVEGVVAGWKSYCLWSGVAIVVGKRFGARDIQRPIGLSAAQLPGSKVLWDAVSVTWSAFFNIDAAASMAPRPLIHSVTHSSAFAAFLQSTGTPLPNQRQP
jgi:hypothetical protein